MLTSKNSSNTFLDAWHANTLLLCQWYTCSWAGVNYSPSPLGQTHACHWEMCAFSSGLHVVSMPPLTGLFSFTWHDNLFHLLYTHDCHWNIIIINRRTNATPMGGSCPITLPLFIFIFLFFKFFFSFDLYKSRNLPQLSKIFLNFPFIFYKIWKLPPLNICFINILLKEADQ